MSLVVAPSLDLHIAQQHKGRYTREGVIQPYDGFCAAIGFSNGVRLAHIPGMLDKLHDLAAPNKNGEASIPTSIINLARRNINVGPQALFSAAQATGLLTDGRAPASLTIPLALCHLNEALSMHESSRRFFCQCGENSTAMKDAQFGSGEPVYFMRTTDTAELSTVFDYNNGCTNDNCKSHTERAFASGFLFSVVVSPSLNLTRKPHRRIVIGTKDGPRVFRLGFALIYRATKSFFGPGVIGNANGPKINHVDTYIYNSGQGTGFYVRNGMRYPESQENPDPAKRVQFASITYYRTEETITDALKRECSEFSDGYQTVDRNHRMPNTFAC